MSVNNNPGLEKFDKTRRQYLFIIEHFSSLIALKVVNQCAFLPLQYFSTFYFALLSLFLAALLFREETFRLLRHSHWRLSARLPHLSFNLEKNEQRCWLHLSTSLLFTILTSCSLSFFARSQAEFYIYTWILQKCNRVQLIVLGCF